MSFKSFLLEDPTEPANLISQIQSGDVATLINQLHADIQPTVSPEDAAQQVGVSQKPALKGIIRKVKFAHLVSKRLEPDGTYTELWAYNTGNKDKFKDELEIRKNILAGTDIESNKTQSDDGNQTSELWSCGNLQIMCIRGLQN